MYAFQAIIRKGKPNWFSLFTLWFSFKVTTEAVQTLLFTAPLNTFYFQFLSWLEPCFSWGNSCFPIVLGLSHCLLDPLLASCSYNPSRKLQNFWQSTSLAASCQFWVGGVFFESLLGFEACWEHWTALSWYHDLPQFCVVPMGPAVSKRWRGFFFFFLPSSLALSSKKLP